MASKRDLVQAHTYNRQRLVSAFASGAPGGKEVETLSRARPVVAGVVLAALAVAGIAVSGLISPSIPEDWDQQRVVITASSGERFLALDGVLYPVINTASARLLLPSETGFNVEVVPDEVVDAAPRGSTIGIVGAPDDLPRPESLHQSGWTACLADSGATYVAISPVEDAGSAEQAAPIENGAVVLQDGGENVVVIDGVRYPVPQDRYSDVVRVLALDATEAVPASGVFTDLYAPGSELVWPLDEIAELGEPLPQEFGSPGGAKTSGQLLRIAGSTSTFALLTAGGVAPVSDFAAALYSTQAPGGLGVALDITHTDLAGIPVDSAGYAPADWPTVMPEALDGRPCAVLDTTVGARPEVQLAAVDAEHEIFEGRLVSMAPGHGALVRASSTAADQGPVYLVDQTATRFQIIDPSEETLARLGFSGEDVVTVPPSWLVHLADGPALSEESARRAVSQALGVGEEE